MASSENELSDASAMLRDMDFQDNIHISDIYTVADNITLNTYDSLDYKMNEFGSDIDADKHLFNTVGNYCKYYSNEQSREINTDGAFTVIHVNSRSLYKNFDNIKELLSQFKKFSVIAVSETWLDDEKGPEVEMVGYELFTLNRNRKKGGGVALYINSNFRSYLVDNMSTCIDGVMECISVEIILGDGKKNDS